MSLAYERARREPELSGVRGVDIRCDDCGRTKRMPPGQVARHLRDGTQSLIGFHNRLYCSLCRDRGGQGRNVSVIPVMRRVR